MKPKTVKAWGVKTRRGKLLPDAGYTKAYVEQYIAFAGDEIIRVEIKEIPRKRRKPVL